MTILCSFLMFEAQFLQAKQAARTIARLDPEQKNALLSSIAAGLEQSTDAILTANTHDLDALQTDTMSDRLRLDDQRLRNIAAEVRNVMTLPDPVGDVLESRRLPNGLRIERIRVPLGVIGMIYESRPNVTIDAAVLALKSGNAIGLKGGKESLHSNRALVAVLHTALRQHGLPEAAVQFLDTTERDAVAEMLTARNQIDVIIPRGGRGLIDYCVRHAQVPVIETGASVVHTYIDAKVDLEQAIAIVANEKVRRPSVCNAVDTVLVHTAVAADFVRGLAAEFTRLHEEKQIPLVSLHADETAMATLAQVSYAASQPLAQGDFEQEWLDYILNLAVIPSLDDALSHIRQYSLGHSESICSTDQTTIETFLQDVDAACVYANASTAFSDGAQFGLGAEIGISTQKMHVRGPFALEGLTTYKWIVRGDGHVRA